MHTMQKQVVVGDKPTANINGDMAVSAPASPLKVDTLYIFPHAGGSAGSYAGFARAFGVDMKRLAVQYPGRSDRHDVPDIASIPALADGVYTMLAAAIEPGSRVAFFGHSMGGLVAFEVARRFEAQGKSVEALFLSASAAPGHAGYEYLHQGSDDDLLKMVCEVTGAESEFIGSRFGDTILRTLRNYGAITEYTCPAGTTVACPIYAYAAAEDTAVSYQSVRKWSEFTTSVFAIQLVPGPHLYITENFASIVADIEHRIAQYEASGIR